MAVIQRGYLPNVCCFEDWILHGTLGPHVLSGSLITYQALHGSEKRKIGKFIKYPQPGNVTTLTVLCQCHRIDVRRAESSSLAAKRCEDEMLWHVFPCSLFAALRLCYDIETSRFSAASRQQRDQ